MKKKIIELYPGFTIAELLISMLIVMVVAAAMVPIIGPKKIKVPNISRSHGIFECYYENGVLMQYQANNRGQKDAEPKKSEYNDHCVFTVPAADKYEIFAIGAGSDGYRDPAGVGYNIKDNTIARSGIIHLTTLHEDIANASMGDLELQGVVTLSKEIHELFDDWVDDIVSSSGGTRYLYAAFTDIKSPVAKGGAGLAARKISWNNLPNGANCMTACTQNTIECKGPYEPNTHWSDTDNVEQSAINAGMCYWYIHAHGSDSAKGRVMKPGTTLLVPIDADRQSQFSVQNNLAGMRIRSVIRDGREMDLDLKVKPQGKDAYKKISADGRVSIFHGENPQENTPWDSLDNTSGARIASANVITKDQLNTYFPFEETRRSRGAQFGRAEGEGLKRPGEPAQPGSATYKDDAFEWSYTALGVDYKYGYAGTPGEVLSMAFNKLSGKLYLFPGTASNSSVLDTVVSRTESREDKEAYIIHAASRQFGSSSTSELLPLSTNIMPNPHGDIKARATADNSIFNQYISRINESGFRGGLFNCDKDNFCPGYAGSGAYPFIVLADGTNTLRIRDLQTLYNNGSYSKQYRINIESKETPKCDFGPIHYGLTKSYTDINGQKHSYQDMYCVASGDTRRDGAVVIVW